MSRVSPSKRSQSKRVSLTKVEFERSHLTHLSDYITALMWSAKGQELVATSSAGEVMVWRWDVDRASSLEPEPSLLTVSNDHSISCLGISASGLVAAGGQDGTASVWDLAVPADGAIATFGEDKHWIDQLAWHPVQDYLAFSAGPYVQVWNVPKRQQLATLNFEASSVLGIEWHPSADILAVSGHGGVKFWNSTTWEEEAYQLEVPGASISLAWSPDGDYLASGNLDRTLSVLRRDSPPPWLMQGFPGKVRQVAWSPKYGPQGSEVSTASSLQLAATCTDGIIVWEQDRDGTNWRSSVLQGHRGTVKAIAYHPIDPLLTSGSTDGQVYVWHHGKKLRQTLSVQSPGVSSLAWHPDGGCLAVGGTDGTLEIWTPSQRGRGFA